MTRGALRGDALAAVSGVLVALSFPKFGHGAVAWLALVPLLLAIPGRSGLAAFRLGYVTGAVSSLGLLYWTALVVLQFGDLPLPVAVAVMTLLCLAVALFPAAFSWVVSVWVERLGAPALWLAPFAWVGTEILRAHTLLRFSWCLLGYSQAEFPELIQVAAYTAVYGVSFAIVAVSSAAAVALRAPRSRAWAPALLALGLVAALWGFGRARLAAALPDAPALRVGLVQANISQDQKWDADRLYENFGRHVELTRRAAGEGARLVVWPESALAWGYDTTPEIAGELRELAKGSGVWLAFGNDDREPAGGRAFVGAKLLAPDGSLALRYHKVRLVPFGEYVPLKPLLTLGGRVPAKLVQQVADFSPGDEARVGDAAGTRLGVFICYEAIFPDFVRRFSVGGAGLLVNITNDGWYGTTSAPYQHFAMAVFRAVENGRFLVRAANTGISGVVDPRGRVLARTRLQEPALLTRDLPVVALPTFYARHGDVFAWGCLGFAGLLSAVALGRARI